MKKKITKYTIALLSVLVVMSLVGAVTAASIDLVHKNPTDWSEIPPAATLTYSMPCGGDDKMTYTFVADGSEGLLYDTGYSLVFYSHDGTATWNPDTVWGKQVTTLIKNGITDSSGALTLSGDFTFRGKGQGLEYIDDDKDYDGSVLGAKVWLVPSSDYSESESELTNWNPTQFLFETELVTCTDIDTKQTVKVRVSQSISGFSVDPTTYDYGEIPRGQYSTTNPDGPIKLKNTGTTNLQISTTATGIFENIEYSLGPEWINVNTFSTEVDAGEQEVISTRICIPLDAEYGDHKDTVTFEYIAISP